MSGRGERLSPDLRGVASGFAHVDRQEDPARAIAYLDAQGATPFWRKMKKASIEALHLRPGQRALDVGCGAGDDVRAMALLVGDGGLAVGVDRSRALIEAARKRRPAALRAVFDVAEATQLPFSAGAFDGVRTERTLQHVADPAAAVAEIARVAGSGARIVAIEPDWDTLVIEAEPLAITRVICRRWADSIPNPAVGRALARLFPGAGISQVRTLPLTSLIEDLPFAEQQFEISSLVAGAEADGAVEAAEGRRWLEGLRQRSGAGRFFCAVTYFCVSGRKPGPRSR